MNITIPPTNHRLAHAIRWASLLKTAREIVGEKKFKHALAGGRNKPHGGGVYYDIPLSPSTHQKEPSKNWPTVTKEHEN